MPRLKNTSLFIAALSLIFLFSFLVEANTPPGFNGDVVYNKNGQFGAAPLTPNSLLGEVTTASPIKIIPRNNLAFVTTGGTTFLDATVSGSTSALGTATTANPYITGDFTSGFFTPGPAQVAVEASGVEAMLWTSTGVTVPSISSFALVGTATGGLLNNIAVPAGSGLQLTATSLSLVGGSSTPTGPAGGDLGSTYPNPTVISIGHVTTGILGVANGGTANSSLTANGVLYGNGTSAIQATSTAANSALITSSTGVPLESQTLPSAVQLNITNLGSVTTGTFNISGNNVLSGTTTIGIADVTTLSVSNCIGCVTGNAGGDLSGTYPNPSVYNLKDITTGIGDANYGTGWAQGDALYATITGGVGGLQADGNGNTIQKYEASNMLYGVTQELLIDPRFTGATCDAEYFDGRNGSGLVTLTAGSPTMSISGRTPTTADIGKSFAANLGSNNPGDAGLALVTIIGVNSPSGTFTMSANPTQNTTSGYGVLGHNDTSAIHAAAASVAMFHGSRLMVPDHCAIRELTLANGVMLDGGDRANGYTYGNDIKPTWYALMTGFSTDTGARYAINTSTSSFWTINGFMIKGPVFPYTGPFFSNQTISLIGSKGGTPLAGFGGSGPLIENMTLNYAFVGIGYALNESGQSGCFSGFSRFNELANTGYGFNGCFNDYESIGDVESSQFTEGMHLTAGTGMRMIGGRTEEAPNSTAGNGGLDCNSCVFTSIGHEWQFQGSYNIYLTGNYIANITGGAIEGGGVAETSGHQAQIALAGTTSGGGVLNLSNVFFDKANASPGGSSQYIFDITTAAANNNHVTINGGDVCLNGYSTALINTTTNFPTHYIVNTNDCPQTNLGHPDISISNGAVGYGISPPTTGAVIDMSLDNSTTNSTIILPNGSPAVRPVSPQVAMYRYNTSASSPEYFNGSVWNSAGAPLPNYIGGLTLLNDTTTATTYFDIQQGTATSDDYSTRMDLTSPYTKNTGSWVVGSGNGCLDTGSIAASTYYSVFLIEKFSTQTVDILCSTSAASPTLPTGYNVQRRLNCGIKTDGSSHILPFTQDGDNCWWTTPTLDINTAIADTTTHLETLNVPTGVKVVPHCSYSTTANGNAALLYSPDTTPAAATTTSPFAASPGYSYLAETTTPSGNSGCPFVTTNTSGQIGLELALSTTTTVGIITQGWTELKAPTATTLALDGTSTGSSTSVTGTTTLSTTSKNDVIILMVDNEGQANVPNVASVADTAGLVWTLRKRNAYNSTFLPIDSLEEWYAVSPAILSSDVITVTMTSTFQYNYKMQAFGISGANTNKVFDINASLPAASNSGNGSTTSPLGTTVSTSHAYDFVITAFGAGAGSFCGASATLPSGFTALSSQCFGYQIINSPLSAVTYNYTFTGTRTPAMITDAIVAAGP